MMSRSSVFWVRYGFAVWCACVLVGCAIKAPLSAEESVAQRARARWESVIAGDWQGAYLLSTPAYRATVDVWAFRSTAVGAVKYKSVDIRSVVCEMASCVVKVRIGYAPVQSGFPDLTTDFDERWVLDDGQWWRFEKM